MATYRKYTQQIQEIGATITSGTLACEGIESAGHSSQFYVSLNGAGTSRRSVTLRHLDFKNNADNLERSLFTTTVSTTQYKDLTSDGVFLYHQSNATSIPVVYRLHKYDKLGNQIKAIFSGTGTVITSIACSKWKNGMWIGSGANLKLVDFNGNILKSLALGFTPTGLCDDGHGLWAVAGTNTIRKIDYNGNVLRATTGAGTARCICTDGHFIYTGA